MLKKRLRLLILGVILLIALFLRILAAKPGFPPIHPDEPVVYSIAKRMIVSRSLNPERYDYPTLSMLINALFYQSFFLPLAITKTALLHPGAFLQNLGSFESFVKDYVLRGQVDPVLFWGRYVSVFFGTATVLMLYLLAKEAFNESVGLVAAFLLAVNYRHLIASVLALPGVFNTFMQTSAFYLFLLLLRQPSRKKYLFSGLLIGLVLATKYQMMIFFPFFLVHFFVSLKEERTKEFFKKLFGKDFFLALIVIPIIFFLTNPYILIDFQNALEWILWTGKRYEAGVIRWRITPLWYLYETILTRPVTWAAILGVFLGFVQKKYWPKTISLFSFILLFFFVLLVYTHGGIYGRSFTPLVPFILIFTALSVVELSRKKILLAGLITLLISFVSIKNSLITSSFLAKDWNLNCAKRWMLENLSRESKVGIVSPTPMDAFVRKKAEWVFFEPKEDFTLSEVQKSGIDYLVINLNALDSNFVNWINADNLFWEMPSDVFDNSLTGLVFKQLSHYSVKQCFKPWQVPEHNFLIVKVPVKKEPADLDLVKFYSFDEKKGELPTGWQVRTVRPTVVEGFSWESGKVCQKGGCLKAAAGSSPPFQPVRFVSEAIPIKPGKKYLVEAWIKAEKNLESQERDGFLRIDFYPDEKLINGERGIIAAVSARVWGDKSWQEKSVEEVAPGGAKFMRISLQHQASNCGFFFDEIKLYETTATEEEKKAANRPEIDSAHAYPETIL